MSTPREIDWERLDKRKFFVVGGGIYSGITLCLFPLTVIKTRQMALDNVSGGLKGSVDTAKMVLRREGVRGLYAGLGTVVCGLIPARMLYISSLEAGKSRMEGVLKPLELSEPVAAGLASFVGGGLASATTSVVTTPIDVVSQRQMVEDSGDARKGKDAAVDKGTARKIAVGEGAARAGGGAAPGGITARAPRASAVATAPASATALPAAQQTPSSASRGRLSIRPGGVAMARRIVRTEGLSGLYRGVGASLLTYVPSNAIWWASYGAWQRALWQAVGAVKAAREGGPPRPAGPYRDASGRRAGTYSEAATIGVQAVAGVFTGWTSAVLTNPLDVVRTRLQTAARLDPTAHPSWREVAGRLAREEGPKGFFRGLGPRMFSAAAWGTAMVSTYEFLKRLCALPGPDDDALA